MPDEYIEDGETVNLQKEIERLKFIGPRRVSSVAMILWSILWDMVTLEYDRSYPYCYGDDLRVVKIRNKDSKVEIPILHCETCIWQKGIYQEIPESTEYDYLPLTKEEVKRYINGEKI